MNTHEKPPVIPAKGGSGIDWSMCGPAGLCAAILTLLFLVGSLVADKLNWTLFLPILYFLPGIVAETRHHRNRLAIFLLNLFLGVTVIGWLAALIWAVWVEKPAVGQR